MRVPQWLSLLVAFWVMTFGIYRLWLARNPKQDLAKDQGKKGLFAMNRRTHLLIGLVYVLLGTALIATSFGWNPMAGLFAPDTPTTPGDGPAKPKAKGGIEIN
jgi:uncharacterized Tic20 family protein